MSEILNQQKILSLDLGCGQIKSSIGWAVRKGDDLTNAGCDIIHNGDNKNRSNKRRQRVSIKNKKKLLKRSREDISKTFNLSNDFYDVPKLPKHEREDYRAIFYNNLNICHNSKIDLLYLARIIYHFQNHRGYIDCRVLTKDDKDEQGKIKSAIANTNTLRGNRTIGQYIYDQVSSGLRFRNTTDQYNNFFNNASISRYIFDVLNFQKQFHPEITDNFIDRNDRRMKFKNPLKSVKSLIGFCEFEIGKKRISRYDIGFQKFRLMQQLDNLTINFKPLSSNQYDVLYNELLVCENLGKQKIKKLLKLKSKDELNIEDKKGILGCSSNAVMVDAFGKEWWDSNSDQEKKVILDYIYGNNNKINLYNYAFKKLFGGNREKSIAFSNISLEEGRANLSKAAIDKISHLMLKGMTYSMAVQKLYNGNFYTKIKIKNIYDIPGFKNKFNNKRVLSVAAKALKYINKFKPDCTNIESTREKNKSKYEKNNIHDENNKNRSYNECVREILRNKFGYKNTNSELVEKYKLWEESKHRCIYCGIGLDFKDVERDHIFPQSRYIDSEMSNLICSCRACNSIKSNMTPFEAFGGNKNHYSEILKRIRTTGKKAKIFKFEEDNFKDMSLDFMPGDLNKTSNMALAVFEIARHLYGLNPQGKDKNGITRVRLIKPSITTKLRKITRIYKDRIKDHRHHAQDAAFMSLVDEEMLQDLKNEKEIKISSNFIQSIYDIEKIEVKHHTKNKANRQMHKETLINHKIAEANPEKYIQVKSERYYELGENHHIECFKNFSDKYSWKLVTVLEANRRKSKTGRIYNINCDNDYDYSIEVGDSFVNPEDNESYHVSGLTKTKDNISISCHNSNRRIISEEKAKDRNGKEKLVQREKRFILSMERVVRMGIFNYKSRKVVKI